MQLMDGHHEFPRSPATAKAINVGRDREISDTLIMGLRLTQEGILREGFQLRFGVDILELYGPTIDKYRGFGLLSVDDERVCLTDRGRLLSNVILREFV
jgi:oxygen-independent coproporphyrinogen-3 oxidase